MLSQAELQLCSSDDEVTALRNLLFAIRTPVRLEEIKSILEAIRSTSTNSTTFRSVPCVRLACKHWQNDAHKLEQKYRADRIDTALHSFLLKDLVHIVNAYAERYKLETLTSGMALKVWNSVRKQWQIAQIRETYRICNKDFFVLYFRGYGDFDEFVSAQSLRLQPLYRITDNILWREFHYASVIYQHLSEIEVWSDHVGEWERRSSLFGLNYERFCAPVGTFTR